jgi:hypothetical protein
MAASPPRASPWHALRSASCRIGHSDPGSAYGRSFDNTGMDDEVASKLTLVSVVRGLAPLYRLQGIGPVDRVGRLGPVDRVGRLRRLCRVHRIGGVDPLPALCPVSVGGDVRPVQVGGHERFEPSLSDSRSWPARPDQVSASANRP